MNAVLFVFAASRPYRRALYPILCGMLVIVSVGASTAIAQTGAALAQQLDSIAGASVREARAVGITAAVVKGKGTLRLKAYGKSDVEGNVPMTVDIIVPLGSDTKQFTAGAILQLRDARAARDTADEESHGHSRRRLQGHQPLSVHVPNGDDGDLQQHQLLAAWSRHREGERNDVRGLHREEDPRAAGHDAIDVLQQLTGDASLLLGSYKGPGRGTDMVIEVTQTPQGIAFSFDGVAAGPLPWVETWTFRRGSSLLTFRRSTTSGPATELRFDTGGDHFILKRQ